jgi:hypothetical protein
VTAHFQPVAFRTQMIGVVDRPAGKPKNFLLQLLQYLHSIGGHGSIPVKAFSAVIRGALRECQIPEPEIKTSYIERRAPACRISGIFNAKLAACLWEHAVSVSFTRAWEIEA